MLNLTLKTPKRNISIGFSISENKPLENSRHNFRSLEGGRITKRMKNFGYRLLRCTWHIQFYSTIFLALSLLRTMMVPPFDSLLHNRRQANRPQYQSLLFHWNCTKFLLYKQYMEDLLIQKIFQVH